MKNCGKSKLKYVCEISAGQSAPQGNDKYSENGIPFIRAGNLEALTLRGNEGLCQKVSQAVAKEHKLKLYPKGTILFAKSGMSTKKGYVHVLKENAYVVSHLACIIPTDKIEPDFLKYYFLYNKPNRLVRDDSYPSISLLDISNITIPLPTLTDQILIINIFKKIEKQIFNKKLQLEKLEQLAKSRFIEMFGDNHSELVPLEQLCDFIRNGANIRQSKGSGGYPITRIETISNNVFNLDRLGYAGITTLDKYENYILKNGDILVSHINSEKYLGRAVQYKGQQKIIHGMNLLCVRPKETTIATFLEYYLRSKPTKEYISKITKKAVNQASFSVSDYKKLLVMNISKNECMAFNSFIEQLDKSKFRMKMCLKIMSFIRHL